MASTGSKNRPDWSWPEDLPGRWKEEQEPTDSAHEREQTSYSSAQEQPPSSVPNTAQQPEPSTAPKRERQHWPPRTCRICLEVVLPSFSQPLDRLASVFQGQPSVTYESPDSGRLLCPCKCKGSQKYVHEGCLTAWRLADPLQKRNYWQCPTCRYSYRLERLTWGRWIGSTTSQILLTILIFLTAIFLLGFVADPIINLYLDPSGTITSPFFGSSTTTYADLYSDEPASWPEHFVKGLASLGLLGFLKFFLTLSPWHWWNIRGTGMLGGGGGGRPAASGRDRLAQISWMAVLIGVATVTYRQSSAGGGRGVADDDHANLRQAVWKGVRAWSRKMLGRAAERVLDVPGNDNDEED
ncbi:hypothetical protein LTR50_004421 [Elasticomyces elasticus]|nr:hypothetical protein LTR50_004421 [Elasticomyces elasticus]